MSIENQEDAKIYLDAVVKHLKQLRILSLDAGLNTHASIWLAVEAAFLQSSDEIDTVVGIMGMYVDGKLRQIDI